MSCKDCRVSKEMHQRLIRSAKGAVPKDIQHQLRARYKQRDASKRFHPTKHVRFLSPQSFSELEALAYEEAGEHNWLHNQILISLCSFICSGEHGHCKVCDAPILFGEVCSAECTVAMTQTKSARKSRIKTNLKRYGGTNPMHSAEIAAKVGGSVKAAKAKWTEEDRKAMVDAHKQTMLERYGVENAGHSEHLKAKAVQTSIERYGTANPASSPVVRARIKSTFLEKYGVENPSQLKEVQKKIRASQIGKHPHTYKIKTYETKDKRTLRLQGYEPIVAAHAEANGWRVRDNHDVCIEYVDGEGKTRHYFPDLFITNGKRKAVVEVKSYWTARKDLDQVLKKAEAARRWCEKNKADYVFTVVKGGKLEFSLSNVSAAKLRKSILAGA